jgi:NAD(P)-dependent dehydrogenase (short-subunit alcohol dehydrogenase family)
MASTHNLQASKLFSVKDYVCVVTGGGSGIGLMAAQALAANGKTQTPFRTRVS